MRTYIQPTTSQNVTTRLFLRFFLCYMAGAAVALLFAVRGRLITMSADAGLTQLCFVGLALLGAFLTVSRPYLLALTLIKSFFDVALLASLMEMQAVRTSFFWAFNASLFYVLLSFVLFCFTASGACLFSHLSDERDLRLLFSGVFLRYLPEILFFSTLAFSLYLLWPYVIALYL